MIPLIDEQSLLLGQHQLADQMRLLLNTLAPEHWHMLEHEEDGTFLEPLLFSYFAENQPHVTLDQILFGYLDHLARPASIKVWSNRDGVVELPRIGYLRSKLPSRQLRLIWNGGPDACVLHGEGIFERPSYEPILTVEGTPIELCRHPYPLCSRLFANEPDGGINLHVESARRLHAKSVANAMTIIQTYLPGYYTQLSMVTKRILLYSRQTPFSFATLSAHGIAFLNTSEEDDEVFFIEDLVHQCGHVIFSTLSPDSRELLRLPANTPLKQLNGDDRDPRDIYSTLHGIFTEAWMNRCFDLCCCDSRFTERQKHEILGRFALILARFGCDLRNLNWPRIFTDKGRILLDWCIEVHNDIVARRYDLLAHFNLSNQPYCFNYKRFAEVN